MNLLPKTRKEYEETCKQMAELSKKSASAEERLNIQKTLAELLAEYQGEDKIIHSSELEEKAKALALVPPIYLPHETMSKATGGIRPRQIIVVSGTVKQGKSQFLYDMVTRMEKTNPLLLYFEDRPIDIIQKMFQFNKQYKIPHFYTPEMYLDDSLDWIKMCMLEAKFKWGSKIVVIDNLHYLTQGNSQVGRYDKFLSNYTKELKEFAIKWNITIFLIAHMNKTPEDRAPTAFDIADSAGIGQIADKVWFIKRNPDEETQSIWYSDRDRQTGFKGQVIFNFNKGSYSEDIVDVFGDSTNNINKLTKNIKSKY